MVTNSSDSSDIEKYTPEPLGEIESATAAIDCAWNQVRSDSD